jgi:hypothetical protein
MATDASGISEISMPLKRETKDFKNRVQPELYLRADVPKCLDSPLSPSSATSFQEANLASLAYSVLNPDKPPPRPSTQLPASLIPARPDLKSRSEDNLVDSAVVKTPVTPTMPDQEESSEDFSFGCYIGASKSTIAEGESPPLASPQPSLNHMNGQMARFRDAQKSSSNISITASITGSIKSKPVLMEGYLSFYNEETKEWARNWCSLEGGYIWLYQTEITADTKKGTEALGILITNF